MLRVQLDGLDHQVKFVGAVDLTRHAVIVVWRDDPGFSEVIQLVNPSSRIVFHDEHDTAAAFRPREQNEMIGAEVEHESGQGRKPGPASSAVEGLPGGLLRAGYHHSAAPS